MKPVKAYNYEWDTEEKIITNIKTIVKFPCHGIGSLAEITGITAPDAYRKAHTLWLKLKQAFNEEAKTYDPEAYDSELGSVGSVDRREVLRTRWWDLLSEYPEEDYYHITRIIEALHSYEKLETGTILFGS